MFCNLCLKGSKRTCEDKQDELDEESNDEESSDKESSDKESSNLECMSSDNSHVDKFVKNTAKPSTHIFTSVFMFHSYPATIKLSTTLKIGAQHYQKTLKRYNYTAAAMVAFGCV